MEQHTTKISNAQIDALPSKTICWNCKKSCGKCSWSESFTPVAGWEVAEGYNSDQRTKTQDIISCPLYEQEYKYFTMDEIFETIAHHFGKHPKTVRRYGKIRTPFVYATKYQEDTGEVLPTWFWCELELQYGKKHNTND